MVSSAWIFVFVEHSLGGDVWGWGALEVTEGPGLELGEWVPKEVIAQVEGEVGKVGFSQARRHPIHNTSGSVRGGVDQGWNRFQLQATSS